MTRERLLVALLTPFTPAGEIDLAALRGHVRYLSALGIRGYFVCGTTGEGPLLDDDEVCLVTRTVREACGDQSFLISQVGRPSTKASLSVMTSVLRNGASAVTAVTPYYYALNDVQLEAHYLRLLDAAHGHPLYAYTIPRRTGNDLHPELVRSLARKGLTGIKDSSRSLDRHVEYLDIRNEPPLDRFEVYMGTDSLVLEGLDRGATGIVSAIANVSPDLFVALHTALTERRDQDALRHQQEINTTRDSLQKGDTITNLKSALNRRLDQYGVAYATTMRSPLGSAA